MYFCIESRTHKSSLTHKRFVATCWIGLSRRRSQSWEINSSREGALHEFLSHLNPWHKSHKDIAIQKKSYSNLPTFPCATFILDISYIAFSENILKMLSGLPNKGSGHVLVNRCNDDHFFF